MFCALAGVNATIISMRNQTRAAICVLAASILSLGSSVAAQQTSSTTTKPATAAKTGTSTTKTGATTGKAATSSTSQPLKLTTQKEKLSYAIGMNIGASMKKDGLDIDPAILTRAVKDGLTGAKPAMTEEEAKTVITSFRNEMIAKKQAEEKKVSDENKLAGEKFLAANKSKEGVVALPDGLQYKVIKQGDGPKPTASDTVVAKYRGTLINGTEFDNSEKHGGTAEFPVGQVIKGWTEALQLMPVGSKWQLFIPPDLAYGQRSPAPEIGPNATLVFDVELVSIKEKEKPEASTAAPPPAPDKPQAQPPAPDKPQSQQ
jgi:FKBP-type peptidyl-prolyl cis-trans isomerase